ncbi:MAG: insulinase family protein [Chloroflexi bacterium]|nr:insulinase family protein [Chloroflexota bacterium]
MATVTPVFYAMPQQTMLENGIRLIHLQLPGTFSVGVSIGVDVGSADEPGQWAGIAHFLEHLVFRGTEHFPTSVAIGQAVENFGGEYNAFTGKTYTQFICSMPLSYRSMALAIVADLVAHPLLRVKDIEEERPVVLREISLGEDSSWQRVIRALEQVVWPETTMARPIIGYEHTLVRISAADVMAFWRAHYQPRSTICTIAGDLSFGEAQDLAVEVLGSWHGEAVEALAPSVTGNISPRRVRWEEMPDRQETVFAVGAPTPGWRDIDHSALAILGALLADGEGSLFARELVRRSGLLHQTGMLTWINRDKGALGFTGAVRPDMLTLAVRELLRLLAKVTSVIPERDFARARGYARGEVLRLWLRPIDVAIQLCHQALLGSDKLGPNKELAMIEAVSPDQVAAMLRSYLVPEHLHFAVAGPSPNLESLESLL